MNPNLQKIKFVKEKANIVDVISHFVQLKRNGSGWNGLSPFSDERSPSFTVSHKGFFKCFSTGKSGDVIDFVMAKQGCTKWDAIDWITDFYNLPKTESDFIPREYITPETSYIHPNIYERTLTINGNFFVDWLKSIYPDRAIYALQQYNVGTSKYWPGATVFWQVDTENRIRGGKILVYDPKNGKRIKNPKPLITWAHKALKLRDYNLSQCLFGEHLLNTYPEKDIGIVESEKSAIVCSIRFPAKLWLASGGLNNLSASKCNVLAGRKVTLYPDRGAEEQWEQKRADLETLIPKAAWHISYLYGSYEKGYDICDWIIDEMKEL